MLYPFPFESIRFLLQRVPELLLFALLHVAYKGIAFAKEILIKMSKGAVKARIYGLLRGQSE